MQNAKKQRILYLLKVLSEDTDQTHGLSLPEIQDKLEDYNISCERKSLYRDFKALEDFGYTIGKIPARPVKYYLESRLFDPSQITLLVDAVQTSRSLTKGNSQLLIKKIKRLVSKNEAKKIDARVLVADRVKTQNESIFNELDSIQTALAEKRDISFSYMRYDVNKKLQVSEAHDGKTRQRTPLFLVYSDDVYYMLAYDADNADHIRSYRVDRMHGIMLLDKSDPSHKPDPDFDIAAYEREMLGMFGGESVSIILQVAEDLVGSIIDIFGVDQVDSYEAEGVSELPDSKYKGRRWANMHVKAAPNPVFFGKIAQFGGDVRIVGPMKVVRAYEQQLNKALEAQEL